MFVRERRQMNESQSKFNYKPYTSNLGESELDMKPPELVQLRNYLSDPKWYEKDYDSISESPRNHDNRQIEQSSKATNDPKKESVHASNSSLIDDGLLRYIDEIYNEITPSRCQAKKSSMANSKRNMKHGTSDESLNKILEPTASSLQRQRLRISTSSKTNVSKSVTTETKLNSHNESEDGRAVKSINIMNRKNAHDLFGNKSSKIRDGNISNRIHNDRLPKDTSAFYKRELVNMSNDVHHSKDVELEIESDSDSDNVPVDNRRTLAHDNLESQRSSPRIVFENRLRRPESAPNHSPRVKQTLDKSSLNRPSTASVGGDSIRSTKSNYLDSELRSSAKSSGAAKLSITGITPKSSNLERDRSKSYDATLFLTHRTKAMRSLHDHYLTSSGVYHINNIPDTDDLLEKNEELLHFSKHITKHICEKNKADNLWHILQTPGYIDVVGSENAFATESKLNYTQKSIEDMDSSYHINRHSNEYAKWVESAALNHHRLFEPSGSMRKPRI